MYLEKQVRALQPSYRANALYFNHFKKSSLLRQTWLFYNCYEVIENLKETIKLVWEALKSDVRTRFGIALSLTIFLLCRPYIVNLPGGQQTFKIMAVPAFLICIIFWVTIFLDIVSGISKKIAVIKNQKAFEKYMLNLSDEEAAIVKNFILIRPSTKDIYTKMILMF